MSRRKLELGVNLRFGEHYPRVDRPIRWPELRRLAKLAEATSRVTIGPFVACTSFRNPTHLAKIADTLDDISGRRLILGLEAGWNQVENATYGYPFDHPAGRFAEALQIVVPLLREGHVDFPGADHVTVSLEP